MSFEALCEVGWSSFSVHVFDKYQTALLFYIIYGGQVKCDLIIASVKSSGMMNNSKSDYMFFVGKVNNCGKERNSR